MNFPLYLDNHATTPLDPDVLQAMLPWMTEKFGNAASKNHSFGWEAESIVRLSREKIAEFIGAEPKELIFTSGATESINLAHFGIAESYSSRGKHIITSAVEHNAVLDSLNALSSRGFEISVLPVDKFGRINLETLVKSIREDTIMVSIMTANNEIGNVYNVVTISSICKERNIIFHTDATQAIGKIPFRANNIDLVSFSGHKIYGPKGIGALYIRRTNLGVKLTPQIYGGGHEYGLRSGTLNVPAIVGLAKAVEIASLKIESESQRLSSYRNKLLKSFTEELHGVRLNGDPDNHLPNNLNLCFEGIRSENLIMNLRNIALSTGSACTSASLKPSHVLKAIGLNDEEAKSAVRFGLGRFNTDEEINFVIKEVIKTVKELTKKFQLSTKEITTH
jgi:cysteine desulfurase